MQGQACVPAKETIISVAAQTHHRLTNCLRLTELVFGRLREQPPSDDKEPILRDPEGAALESITECCHILAGQVEDNITRILDVIGERMPVSTPTVAGCSTQVFAAKR
jgi:hypothetical protein